MDFQVSLPLDSDGFLRRECPHCMQEFKWHHGPANEEAETANEPAACGSDASAAGPPSPHSAVRVQDVPLPATVVTIPSPETWRKRTVPVSTV